MKKQEDSIKVPLDFAQDLMKHAQDYGYLYPKLWVLLPQATNTDAQDYEEECPT